MRDYLIEVVRKGASPVESRNLGREYLQARILSSLQRAGAMIPLAFHGGTALRFLYSNARYSEDLDFALEKHRDLYDFRRYLRSIRAEFEAEGYAIELKVNDQKVVNSALVRFPGLLYELELSPHRSEVIAVKLEVDTRPPEEAILATTIVRRYNTLQLQHHDEASLLAGKLHAILQRPFLKGRDVYDLLWYLSDSTWPAPNLHMLNNALLQTEWNGITLDDRNWREVVAKRLRDASWTHVVDDVAPFLQSTDDAKLLTRDNVTSALLDRP